MAIKHHVPDDAMAREAKLRDCIEAIYKVFGKYKLAKHIEPDPNFPSRCDDRPLRSAPLRELPTEAFDQYQIKAMTTWGSVHDYKHFLPRLLEILSTSQPHAWEDLSPKVEDDTVFSKLQYAHWQEWNRSEYQAVNDYFNALWSAMLVRPLDMGEYMEIIPSLGDTLYAFAKAFRDISRFIERWHIDANHPTAGLTATGHLAKTIVYFHDDLLKDNTCGWGQYSTLAAQEKQLATWLATEEVQQLLETSMRRWPDSPYAELYIRAHDCLGLWKQKRSAKP